MSRNGSGTYTLPLADVVAGTTIEAAWANTTLNDIETALTDSLAKDGQTDPSANLPMNTFRHTGVGAASNRTDYAQAAQVVDGALHSLTSVGGTVDVITATGPLSVAAYVTGQRFSFTAAGANTGAVTININGIAAVAITKNGATALAAGDIANGARVLIEYDGTRFQLVNISSVMFTGGAVSGSSVTSTGTVTNNAVVSPAQITANQDDYAPAGVDTAYEIRVDSDASRNISGISASQAEGRELILTNDGGNDIVLTHEDAGSTAANRFDLGSNSDITLTGGQSVKVRYDGTASRWRMMSYIPPASLPATDFGTGDAKLTFKVAADTGWILADDGTIGNAASGATTRANADTEDLFTLLWDNIDDTGCPVSSGRGASAAADFAANKTLSIPKQLGRALLIAGSGAGLTARTLGYTGGSEDAIVVSHSHTSGTLVTNTTGNHSHTVGYTTSSDFQTRITGSSTAGTSDNQSKTTSTAGNHSHTISGSVASAGSSGTGANMQPWSGMNVMIKL